MKIYHKIINFLMWIPLLGILVGIIEGTRYFLTKNKNNWFNQRTIFVFLNSFVHVIGVEILFYIFML